MWKELFDQEGFQAKYGLRIAERSHSCYNYSYSHGDFLQHDFAEDNEAYFPYLSRERYWYLIPVNSLEYKMKL